MDAILCRESALSYLRAGKGGVPASPTLVATGLHDIRALGLSLDGLDPVHLLSFKAARRTHAHGLVVHVWSGKMPAGALLSTGEKDVLVTSPEFTLLQLAGPPYSTSLQTIRLASLMMELAGTYRRSPTSYGRPRLTSYNNLSRFIETVPHARGRELYCRALHYEMDMSLSPMETAIALLLTLPVRLGGFGLPKPILNVRLRGTELRTDTSSQREILPDLYWPEQEVVLEYDSREHHGETGGVLANDEKLAHDAGRANSLVAAGRHVVTVRRRQATNLGRFDLVARQVAALLGKRLAMPSVEELERRAELHALLIRN